MSKKQYVSESVHKSDGRNTTLRHTVNALTSIPDEGRAKLR